MIDEKEIREEFIKWLTVDSTHYDMRKKDFNQAIFMPEYGGAPCWSRTDLDMVMEKFDRAVAVLLKKGKRK